MFFMTKKKYEAILIRLQTLERLSDEMAMTMTSADRKKIEKYGEGILGTCTRATAFTAPQYSVGYPSPSPTSADAPIRLGKNNITARKILREIMPQNGGFELYTNAYPRFIAHPDSSPLKLASFNAMLARLTREGFLARGRAKGYYRLVLAQDSQ